ncbi:MAG: cation:dicarboxylase symporter family transporter, partial [Negativicutes bacterium]|nr:cation:dicarboxylase symporter family transporter [Negativicutes bacterium]
MLKFYTKMSVTQRIYAATALGIFAGLFWGQRLAVLSQINIMFIQLFQIAIIPYMIFSIIGSIGSMSSGTARLISKRGLIVLLAVWIPSIIFALLLPLSFPATKPAGFFHPPATRPHETDLISLFIPANPFHALAEGYIPAIVIFCLLTGVALIGTANKEGFLQQISFLSQLMSKLNRFIMATMPLGVLVISSYTFGTVQFASLKEMLVYILTSVFYLVFISVLLSPYIVVATAGVSWKKLCDYGLPATLLAFSTGNVFLSLPLIYDGMYKFHAEQPDYQQLSDQERAWRRDIIDIVIPLAWVVPSSYKFLVVFFIQFAAWYYNSVQSLGQVIILYLAGIPALFGSNSVIVPFFLQISSLPAQGYNLFMLVANFLVYFNNANGAIFIIVCTILCYAALTGKIRLRWPRLLLGLLICCAVYAAGLWGMRQGFEAVMADDQTGARELAAMSIDRRESAIYHSVTPIVCGPDQLASLSPRRFDRDLLEQILTDHTLRVGYIDDSIPFSFSNSNHDLVGFDVAMAYDLAHQLDVATLEFYPLRLRDVAEYLNNGKIDIVMSGVIPRLFRQHTLQYSLPYMQLHPAIILPISLAGHYSNYHDVLNDNSITFGVMAGSGLDSTISALLPKARTVLLARRDDYFTHRKADVFLTSAEVGATEIMRHPLFSLMPIENLGKNLFCAYPVSANPYSDNFLDFVNNWLLGCYMDGTIKQNHDYWVLGEVSVEDTYRWSILD